MVLVSVYHSGGQTQQFITNSEIKTIHLVRRFTFIVISTLKIPVSTTMAMSIICVSVNIKGAKKVELCY